LFAPSSPEPAALAAELGSRAGILEHGLFLGLATDVLVASDAGSLTKPVRDRAASSSVKSVRHRLTAAASLSSSVHLHQPHHPRPVRWHHRHHLAGGHRGHAVRSCRSESTVAVQAESVVMFILRMSSFMREIMLSAICWCIGIMACIVAALAVSIMRRCTSIESIM
jgi:hypothetical protein